LLACIEEHPAFTHLVRAYNHTLLFVRIYYPTGAYHSSIRIYGHFIKAYGALFDSAGGWYMIQFGAENVRHPDLPQHTLWCRVIRLEGRGV
jgi:hypothetical protein